MDVNDIGERQIKPPARALLVGRDDNVALMLGNVKAGETITLGGGREQVAAEDIPAGYKIAVHPLEVGQQVINYGHVIGTARRPIQPGETIHTHNLNASCSF